jgi:coniferyl-aldehyde dehydrogenase
MTGTPSLDDVFARQRAAVAREPYPSAAIRKDRIRRALDATISNQQAIIDATAADFGKRPELTTIAADLLYPVGHLKHALKHVEQWMQVERRKADFPFNLLGAKARVFYQPLGTVGIMAPWNLPFALGYAPLAGVLAAGNRALIKPSELTPQTSALMAQITAATFDPEEVSVIEGGVDVAGRFAALPFDHLIFTGGAPIARHVLHAAADNLTPVTLELGGKGPVVLAPGADVAKLAGKIVSVKLANAGQACIGLDHVWVQRSRLETFVAAVRDKFAQYFPDYRNNPDLAHVFLAKQRTRLAGVVDDAAARGVRIEVLGGESTAGLADEPSFPFVLLIDPPKDSAAMRQEMFGPVLPIIPYDTLEEVAAHISTGERPLALYVFGATRGEQRFMLENTWSGGMTFDDTMLHALMQDLPFGGVGHSGMGRYGGFAGFRTFSNARSVAWAPKVDLMAMEPPYTAKMIGTMRSLLKR